MFAIIPLTLDLWIPIAFTVVVLVSLIHNLVCVRFRILRHGRQTEAAKEVQTGFYFVEKPLVSRRAFLAEPQPSGARDVRTQADPFGRASTLSETL